MTHHRQSTESQQRDMGLNNMAVRHSECSTVMPVTKKISSHGRRGKRDSIVEVIKPSEMQCNAITRMHGNTDTLLVNKELLKLIGVL